MHMRKFFLQVPPGLEKVLERELQQLRIPGEFVAGSGGAWAFGPQDTLWKIALKSRVCEGVRAAVAEPFHCAHEATMLQNVRQAPWSEYLPTDVSSVHVKVRVDSVSRLQHTKMIENLVRRGLEVNEEAPDKDANAPLIHVYLKHDKCYLSVDATGPLAHRRYHASPGKCPLRETLASAALLAARVDRNLHESQKGIVLWDPFCGSGTILLEGLSMMLGHPPGSPKVAYPFREFPSHNPEKFQEVCEAISLDPHPRVNDIYLVGTDKDPKQIEAAERNYRRLQRRMPRQSGAEEPDIPCEVSFNATHAIPFGEKMIESTDKDIMIVTNVPYGKRSGSDKDNIKLHRQLGTFAMRHKNRIRGIYLIAAKNSLVGETKLDWRTELRFSNGGIPVEMLGWHRARNSR